MVIDSEKSLISLPLFIIFGFITLFTTFSLLEGLESNDESNKRKLQQLLKQQQLLQQQQQQQQNQIPYFYRYLNVNNNNNNSNNDNQLQFEQLQKQYYQQQQQSQEQNNQQQQQQNKNESFVYNLFKSITSLFSNYNNNQNKTTFNNSKDIFNNSRTKNNTISNTNNQQQQQQQKVQQPVVTSTTTTTTTTQITSVQQLNSRIVELEERLEEELHHRATERKGRLVAEQGLQDEMNHLNILSKKHKELEQQHIGLWKLYTLSNKRKKALQLSMDDINSQLLTLMDQFQHSLAEQYMDSKDSIESIDDSDNNNDEQQPISMTIDKEFIERFETLVESINNLKSPEQDDPLQSQEEDLFLQVTKHSSHKSTMFDNDNDIVKFTDICR
ncbi:hypothetical protein PPL_11472 [Heterostelium album PN500]|uniref:Uncharacterized protein n=1 Tax=Heterostelium pallidum (strain ATCC 26659 / Pp 5 / PN500) TaxID=670386 RepID=D3BTH6_HETP5|nr:hypothetical protein PPL_11472 [Heterostelium album PN500]EFA75393.1 hypothetical protein PPL_11472 [Heterostelium album PN500]|eukprot:XP_020427527.1 hypothetical protein PPL_11472 [Heterostelium album PN500]